MSHSHPEIQKIFEELKAIITNNHFVYTSGKHGDTYINKDAIFPHTDKVQILAQYLAKEFLFEDIDTVIGPALGGIILAQHIAMAINKSSNNGFVKAVFAEKAEDKFIIKRGYDKFIKGKNVLIVEDIINTGGSAKKVIQAVKNCGGEVIGLAVLANRGNLKAKDFGIPKLRTLLNVSLNKYEAEDCPLCKEGRPINVEIGKGREFLAKKN